MNEATSNLKQGQANLCIEECSDSLSNTIMTDFFLMMDTSNDLQVLCLESTKWRVTFSFLIYFYLCCESLFVVKWG